MDLIQLFKRVLGSYKIIIASTIFTTLIVFLLTMNLPKTYVSSATVYTGIGTGVDIENTTPSRVDPRSAFDNLLNIIKSREVMNEVGLRLLALHLSLSKADPSIISVEHFDRFQEQIPPNIRALATGTPEEIYQKLDAIADDNSFLIAQLNYNGPYYSNRALSAVDVKRVNTSDMVSLTYTSNDAGICQHTLAILIEVSVRNYRNIHENQTDKIVRYYEEELHKSQEKLHKSEEQLLRFKQANNLVNYDMQTSVVISQRENIISELQNEKQTLVSTEAGIKNIESSLGSGAQSFKNSEILSKRALIGQLASQLSLSELRGDAPEKVASLQLQINQVKTELNQNIMDASAAQTGVAPNERVLGDYFAKIVQYEESKARLRALESRKNEVFNEYTSFVPLGDTLNRILREIDINQKAYFAVLTNLDQAKLRQQNQQSFSTVQMIDKPNYPLMAQPSKRKIMLALGGMVGFMIPASIVLLIAYFDRALKTPQRAEDATGLKTGGVLPNMKQLQSMKNSDQISGGLSDSILKNLYMSDNQYNQQRILIISTRPSEGKTTISNMLCERLIHKGRKCLVVVPYLDSGSWSVVSYKIDNAFYQSRAEDLVPVERLNDTDVLILELPSLIMNDYPVALIKQFNMAFLVCDANREWTKADQTALDGFIKISGITPQLILNEVDSDIVEDVLGKMTDSKR